MAKRLNRDEAKLHLVYLVARSDFKSGGWFGIGEGDLITDEEEKYLESVSKKEKLKIDWSVFLDQMGDWVDDEEKLWARDRNLLLAEVRDCTISGPRNPAVVCFTSLLSSLTVI